MTTSGPTGRDRRGKVNTGCLLLLLALAVVAYYGVGIGSAYFNYWQMESEMRSQARLAPGLTDEVITRRLVARAQELGLPPEARRIRIRRIERSRQIVITTSWPQRLELPFFALVVPMRPEARAQL
ncbi:MAG: hypothetical protein HY560_10885 [Gemmatimonadetes bacterium]|nr:hypothetical protein [Gemmatimonadota bacterium]